MKSKYPKILCAVAMLMPALTQADSLNNLEFLSQAQFLILSKNAGAATQYKAFAPAEPLGTLGFDVAVELSSTDIDSEVFDLASEGGFDAGTFFVPRVHIHKGLPFNVDIAASLAGIPDTDFRVIGAEVRYAILAGTIATPALAVRLTYSQVNGLDELDMNNLGLEASISKGFAMFTPYGGVGIVRTTSTPHVSELAEEKFSQKKVFAGVNINLGVNVGFEVDVTGDYTTYGAKAGFRF